MVPHVPVCMYAHVREGDMHIAERVKKKTGTKWDRDQPGRATGGVRAEENEGDAVSGAPAKKNASAAFSGRFSAILKRMRMRERRDLIWDGNQLRLFSSRGRVLASIEPDKTGPACGASACPTDTSPTW